MPRTNLLSRADLLACLKRYGQAETAAWAIALGHMPPALAPTSRPPIEGRASIVLGPLTVSAAGVVGRRPSVEDTPAIAAPVEPTAIPTPTIPAVANRQEEPPILLPRVIRYTPPTSDITENTPEQTSEPDWYHKAASWPANDPALSASPAATPPPFSPLIPWTRLWPFLKTVLSIRAESRQFDLPLVVQRLARGELPTRLPRRPVITWAGTCQMLIDFAAPLIPFWGDFHWLRKRLAPLRGLAGLTVLAVPDGDPEGPCLEWFPQQDVWQKHPIYTLPSNGMPLLVLSDLGCLDPNGVRRQPWQRLGQRLHRAGCQPVALMPCPSSAWDGTVTQWFAPVVWDRGTRLTRRPQPWRRQPTQHTPQAWEANGTALLEALGAAVRIEPALLRAVRLLLPDCDVGHEAAAWQHPHLHPTPLAAYFEPESMAVYRRAFTQLPAARRQAVAALLRAHHAHLSPAIAHEEQRRLEASGSAPPSEETAEFLARMLHNVRTPEDPLHASGRAWVQRLARRQEAEAWQDERLVALWVAAHLPIDQDLLPPEGLDPNKADWLLRRASISQRYTLRQRGTEVYIETVPPPQILDVPGSLLGHIHTARTFVRVQSPEPSAAEVWHPLHQALSLPPEGGVILRTEHEEMHLVSSSRPTWTSGMGQDPYGLFVTWHAGKRKAYWVPPGEYPVTGLNGDVLGQRHFEQGFWCDMVEAEELLHHGFRPPAWAEAYGLDAYGLYADCSVYGIQQRLRWIVPGEFMMGSLEREWGRGSDESLHSVLLTRGFWLADTACTQALWQVVMGSNPSTSQDAQHPVTDVSWHEAQAFLQCLNVMDMGGDWRLPTEAEWEYACRAGTSTPYWFGVQITPQQVNHETLRGTVRVQARPCNAWGLYQMHGNVWEWCQDSYAAYTTASAVTAALPDIDPIGPTREDVFVIRGGSWGHDGWGARSAQRDAYHPADRFHLVGFRCARDHGAQPAGQAPEAPGSRPGQARQRKRSARGRLGVERAGGGDHELAHTAVKV